MDLAWLVPIIALLSLLAALVFALAATPPRPAPNRVKSTLARDGGQGGVGWLIPKEEREAVRALRAKRQG